MGRFRPQSRHILPFIPQFSWILNEFTLFDLSAVGLGTTAFLCLQNHSQAFGKPRPDRNAPKKIGPLKSLTCLRRATVTNALPS